MIIIQQIRVTWSKKSRGAPGAALRNAVPKSIPVELEECTFLFESYIFEEWDSFKQKWAVHSANNLIPYHVGNLLLKYQNEALDIGFQWEYRIGKIALGKIRGVSPWKFGSGVGYPYRHDIRSAFHLSSGMFGRLIINGLYRRRGSSTWYSQDIYNIAVFEQPTPDLFISREPNRIIDLRVHQY
jgi:hypothetical protein